MGIKRHHGIFIAALFFIILVPSSFASNGTDDLIHIKTLQDLQNMNSNLSGHYILDNDIDASATENWHCDSNKKSGKLGVCEGFVPIGVEGVNSFVGTFDGNGHVIENLYIHRGIDNYVGLFGYIENADLESVVLRKANIRGFTHTGGIVGDAVASMINNNSFQGQVVGDQYTGGVAGLIDSQTKVTNSSVFADVSGASYVGGVIGATGTRDQIAPSKDAKSDHPGGLDLTPTIEDCYSQGTVYSNYWAGGLVGYNYESAIDNSYSAVKINSQTAGYYGGLIGYNDVFGSISKSFWDTSLSGASMGIGKNAGEADIYGETTGSMHSQSTFTNKGWDFSSIWIMSGGNYPYLRGQYVPNAAIFGNAYKDASATYPLADVEVDLAVNGKNIAKTVSSPYGKYNFWLSPQEMIKANDILMVYLMNNTYKANTIRQIAITGNIENLDLHANRVIATPTAASLDGGEISISFFANAKV